MRSIRRGDTGPAVEEIQSILVGLDFLPAVTEAFDEATENAVRAFQQGRGIPLRAKVVTIALLWASLLYSIYRIDVLLVDIVLCVIGATTTTLILRMKTLKERPGGRGPSGDGGAIGS